MAPYQYEPFSSRPYIGQLADLMQEPGRAQARAAEIGGAAKAQALQQTGQGIGSAIQYATDPRVQMEREQVAAMQRAKGYLAATNQIISQLTTQNPDGTHTLDRGKLQQQLAANNVPLQMQQEVFKSLDDVDNSIQKFNQLRIDHRADFAHAALQSELGKTPQGIVTLAGVAKANGMVTDDDLQPIFTALAQGMDPRMVLQGVRGLSEKYKDQSKPVVLPRPGAQLVSPTGETLATAPATPEKPTAPSPSQTHNMRLKIDGTTKDVPVDYVPNKDGSGGKWMYQGKDVTGQVSVIPPASIQINNQRETKLPPGDWDKTGDDFLASIPKAWRTTVKKIAHYDEDPSKVASLRGGMRETLMQWVNQVNPSYDASMFTNRAPTRKAFTTGQQGQQLTALNTAIEHLDQLQGAADALNNGSFKPGNRFYNYLRDTFGSAMPSNYQTIKNMVDKEVEAVANKGIPTVSGTEEQKKLAGTSASAEAIKGYIDTLIPLMGSKLNALHYQYKEAMGADDPFKPLTPQAQAILTRRGFDPNNPNVKASTAPAVAASAPKEGDVKPIPGFPGMEQTFKHGKWIRTK